MAFNYFYGKQADLYGFVRVPKLLMTEKMFDPISIDAKLLYGLLIDRMSMAKKNDWIDEEKVHVCLCDVNNMPGGKKEYIWPLTSRHIKDCYKRTGNPLIVNLRHVMENTYICNRWIV